MMRSAAEFHFDFGALAPSLKEQAAAQGLKFSESSDHLQNDADAIARLQIRGLIPDSVAHKARERLMRAAKKLLKPTYKHCSKCGLGEGEWMACEEGDCGELR